MAVERSAPNRHRSGNPLPFGGHHERFGLETQEVPAAPTARDWGLLMAADAGRRGTLRGPTPICTAVLRLHANYMQAPCKRRCQRANFYNFCHFPELKAGAVRFSGLDPLKFCTVDKHSRRHEDEAGLVRSWG